MAPRKKHAIPSGLSPAEYLRQWRRLNTDKTKEYQKKDTERHKAVSKSSPAAKMRILVQKARVRAGRKKIFIDLVDDHFELASALPTHCPLWPKEEIGYANSKEQRHNSASIDRLDPKKGYTPENVWIVSYRANRIKSDATLEEMEELCRNWRAELVRRGLIKP